MEMIRSSSFCTTPQLLEVVRKMISELVQSTRLAKYGECNCLRYYFCLVTHAARNVAASFPARRNTQHCSSDHDRTVGLHPASGKSRRISASTSLFRFEVSMWCSPPRLKRRAHQLEEDRILPGVLVPCNRMTIPMAGEHRRTASPKGIEPKLVVTSIKTHPSTFCLMSRKAVCILPDCSPGRDRGLDCLMISGLVDLMFCASDQGDGKDRNFTIIAQVVIISLPDFFFFV